MKTGKMASKGSLSATKGMKAVSAIAKSSAFVRPDSVRRTVSFADSLINIVAIPSSAIMPPMIFGKSPGPGYPSGNSGKDRLRK